MTNSSVATGRTPDGGRARLPSRSGVATSGDGVRIAWDEFGAGDPTLWSLAGTVGRGVALATISAGIGFAIATIGRNTAAALGAGFAYVIVLENILGTPPPPPPGE